MNLQVRLDRDRRTIDRALAQALRFNAAVPKRLSQAMRYAVLGPGKRVRPILALESYRAAGGRNRQWIMPFCCGIELIHTFSLVHDDLPSMDNDDFRRGRPSLHRRFDEATALLAADALLVRAFELFARCPAPLNRRIAATVAICQAIGPAGMVAGQILDMDLRPNTGRKRLLATQRKKTALLIAASIVTGAILAGASAPTIRQLHKAGITLGMLFQLTDDLLDAQQESDQGKATMATKYHPAAIAELARAQAESVRRAFLDRKSVV